MPCAPTLVRLLKGHKAAQAQRWLMLGEGWNDLDLVCERGDGAPMHPDNFTSSTKRAILAAKLPKEMRLHDLRHAVGSVLRLEGVALDVVRDALGHHSVAFTADQYGSVLPQRLAAVGDAMEQTYGTPRA